MTDTTKKVDATIDDTRILLTHHEHPKSSATFLSEYGIVTHGEWVEREMERLRRSGANPTRKVDGMGRTAIEVDKPKKKEKYLS